MSPASFRRALAAFLFTASLAPFVSAEGLVPHASDPALLARHVTCSAEAEMRVMAAGEAQACARNYLLLKLSFLPGVDLDAFEALDLAERHAISMRGYAAYREWRDQQERFGTAAQLEM